MLSEREKDLIIEAMNPCCRQSRLQQIRTKLQGNMPEVIKHLTEQKDQSNETYWLTRNYALCVEAGVNSNQAARLINFFGGKKLTTPPVTFAILLAQGEGRSLPIQ